MTILFPSLDSPELEPFVAPFGRMMLAYGRATAAVIALVELRKANEAEAVVYVTEAGTKELPKRVRQLFRTQLANEQFEQLNRAMTRFKMLAKKRHDLIHGVWWPNERGDLGIRVMRQRQAVESSIREIIGKCFHISRKNKIITPEHPMTISAHDLDQWAKELDGIADILDDIEGSLRRSN